MSDPRTLDELDDGEARVIDAMHDENTGTDAERMGAITARADEAEHRARAERRRRAAAMRVALAERRAS